MSQQGGSGALPANASKVSCRSCDNKVTAPALRLAKLPGCPVCGASPYIFDVHEGTKAMKAALRQLGLPEHMVGWPQAKQAAAPQMGGAAGNTGQRPRSGRQAAVPSGKAGGTRYLSADGRMAPTASDEAQTFAEQDEDVDIQNMSATEYAEYVREKMAVKRKQKKIMLVSVLVLVLVAGGVAIALLGGGSDTPQPPVEADGNNPTNTAPQGNAPVNPNGTNAANNSGDQSSDPKRTNPDGTSGNNQSSDPDKGDENQPEEVSVGVAPAPKGLIVDGLREGEWTYFATDGSVRAKGTYRRGKRVGDWTFSSSSGATFTSSYRDGRLQILPWQETPLAWQSPTRRAALIAREGDTRVADQTLDSIECYRVTTPQEITEIPAGVTAVRYQPPSSAAGTEIRAGIMALSELGQLRHLELVDCRKLQGPDLELISSATSLLSLTLRNVQALNEMNTVALTKLPEIRRLSLIRCGGINDAAMVPIGRMQKLMQLHLDTCPGLGAGFFTHLAQAPHLEELELQSRDWRQPDLPAEDREAPRAGESMRGEVWLETLAKLPHLRVLRLASEGGRGTDSRLFGPVSLGLRALKDARSLEELYLCPFDYAQLKLEELSNLPNLSALTLDVKERSLSTDETLACMRALAGMKGLNSLKLTTARRQQVSYLSDEEAAVLGTLENLRYLDLEASGLRAGDLASLKNLTKLETLALEPSTFLGESLDLSLFLTGIKSLRYLSVVEWRADAWDANGFAALGKLPELRALHLTTLPASGALKALNEAPRLQVLCLPGRAALDWGSFTPTSLESLELGGGVPHRGGRAGEALEVAVRIEAEALAGIARIGSLRALHLSMDQAPAELFQQLRTLSALEYFGLTRVMPDERFTSIAEISALRSLKAINLSGSVLLSNQLARELAELKQLQSVELREVFVSAAQSSRSSVASQPKLDDTALFLIGGLPKLARLDLRCTAEDRVPLSGLGLSALAAQPSLRELTLTPFNFTTPWDFRKLQLELPECRVRVVEPSAE